MSLVKEFVFVVSFLGLLTGPLTTHALPDRDPTKTLTVTQTRFLPASLTFKTQRECLAAAAKLTAQKFLAEPFLDVCHGGLKGADSLPNNEVPNPTDARWAWGVEVEEYHDCYSSYTNGKMEFKTYLAAKTVKFFDNALYRKFKASSLEECRNQLFVTKWEQFQAGLCTKVAAPLVVEVPVTVSIDTTKRPGSLVPTPDGTGLVVTDLIQESVEYKYDSQCSVGRNVKKLKVLSDLVASWNTGLPPEGAYIPCSANCASVF